MAAGGPRPDRRCRRPSTRIGCSMLRGAVEYQTLSDDATCPRGSAGRRRHRAGGGTCRRARGSRLALPQEILFWLRTLYEDTATGGRGTTTTAGSKPTPSGSGCSVATPGTALRPLRETNGWARIPRSVQSATGGTLAQRGRVHRSRHGPRRLRHVRRGAHLLGGMAAALRRVRIPRRLRQHPRHVDDVPEHGRCGTHEGLGRVARRPGRRPWSASARGVARRVATFVFDASIASTTARWTFPMTVLRASSVTPPWADSIPTRRSSGPTTSNSSIARWKASSSASAS